MGGDGKPHAIRWVGGDDPIGDLDRPRFQHDVGREHAAVVAANLHEIEFALERRSAREHNQLSGVLERRDQRRPGEVSCGRLSGP